MQLAKFIDAQGRSRVGRVEGNFLHPLGLADDSAGMLLSRLLASDSPETTVAATPSDHPLPLDSLQLLPPLDFQEVWGAGVTYERSKVAREEESETGGSFYDLVYKADRPELFFKATPRRVVGPGGTIRVRGDSSWSVPEPELALVLSPTMKLVGYTIGNDVSSRDIEGRNPLYLPQAKMYDGSCALGPVVTLAASMPPTSEIVIRMTIQRSGGVVFEGSTTLDRMARSFAELIAWLGRENSFPEGVILMTGTGIVPPDEFTLLGGDEVQIQIDGIGTLSNPVAQGGEFLDRLRPE